MKLRLYVISSIAIILTLFTCLFSVAIIKNLGNILYAFNLDQFGDIFSQLEQVESISPSLFIPLIVYTFFLYLFFINNSKHLVVKLVILFFIYIIIQLIVILFTRVNGFYFIDIILSLLENMEGLGI